MTRFIQETQDRPPPPTLPPGKFLYQNKEIENLLDFHVAGVESIGLNAEESLFKAYSEKCWRPRISPD